MNTIQERIKSLREDRHITQRELAKQIGVVQSSINFWENGTNEPKGSYIVALAKAFDVTTDYLLGLTDEWGNATDISPAELSADKKELLTVYDSLSPTRKQDVLTLIKSFASADASKK